MVIKRLDELEKSALLEMQTASQDYISQMEREETELEKSVSLIEKHLQQLDFLTKNGSNMHVLCPARYHRKAKKFLRY
jgi:hypothetical protein